LKYIPIFFQNSFSVSKLSPDELRAAIYLQVSITGQASIFVVRSVRDLSYTQRPGLLLFLAFIVAQTVATFLAVYGFRGYPFHQTGVKGCGWVFAIVIWMWCIIWYIPLDFIKKLFYAIYYRDWTVFKFQELNFKARFREYKKQKAQQRANEQAKQSEQNIQQLPKEKETEEIVKPNLPTQDTEQPRKDNETDLATTNKKQKQKHGDHKAPQPEAEEAKGKEKEV